MIGAPVTTVRTPALLVEYFKHRAIEARVDIEHVEPAELDVFMQTTKAGSAIDGLLVTMPHKQAMLQHVDVMEPDAQRSGSINAVKRLSDGQWCGAQFDGRGLVNALRNSGVSQQQGDIWLKGLGGAGFAIAQALIDQGCNSLHLQDHDADRQAHVLRRLGHQQDPAHGDDSRSQRSAEILINATPLGMAEGDASPFTREQVARARLIVDIVADPPRTTLAKWAQQAGVPLISGRDMVNGQVPLIGLWLLQTKL